MIDERQVIEILRDDRVTAPGLDPDRVIQGARRRRTRRNTGAVVASAAVAGVAVAGYLVADRPGGTPNGLATTAPVAGSSTATPQPTGKPTVKPTVKPPTRATWDPSEGTQVRTPMMPPGTPRDYPGSLGGTPVFLGCSDVDPHIPVERVHESADVFRRMGAAVDARIYKGMGHTVNMDELSAVRAILAPRTRK